MKRSDVQRSYHQGAGSRPMLNVKHHFYWPDIARKFRGGDHEFADDEPFWDWAQQVWDDDPYYEGSPFDVAEQITRESGWEQAQEDADDIWGMTSELVDERRYFPEYPPGCRWRFTGEKVWRPKPNVKLGGEGRQGGWMVAHGLGDVDEWDLQDLNRWAKFSSYVRSIVADLDYQLVWHLHENVYEPNVLEPLQAEAHAGALADAEVWAAITRSTEGVPV